MKTILKNTLVSLTFATLVGMAPLLAPVAPALAQTGNGITGESVTRNFKLSDLLERRGKIQIGTNVPTSIEFEEPISEQVVGRDDLLIDGLSKAKPNRIYFRAKESKGSSSIDITLEGGATALFTFEINPKITEGLRYVIKGKSEVVVNPEPSAEPTPTSTPVSSAPTTSNAIVPTASSPVAKPNPVAAKPVNTSAPSQPSTPLETLNENGMQATEIALAPVAPVNTVTASKPPSPSTVSTNVISGKPVMLAPIVNAIRQYDPYNERPADVGAFFAVKKINADSSEFELLIENRSASVVTFEPASLNVYVYGYTSPTNPRLVLYLTLAPRFDSRVSLEIQPGGSYVRRFVLPTRFDARTPFEYVANFTVTTDSDSFEYRRSVSF
jgi:hypothetical protein